MNKQLTRSELEDLRAVLQRAAERAQLNTDHAEQLARAVADLNDELAGMRSR